MARITVAVISQVADLVLLSLALLQKITGKTRAEVLAACKAESTKTDELLKKLR